MSAEPGERKKFQRQQQGIGFGGPRGGPVGGLAMPVEKAKDFWGTLRRLTRYLLPYKLSLIAILITAVLSAIFNIVSPKIMGLVTTSLFNGVVAKMQGVPGAHFDFDYILHILLILAVLYTISSFFFYVQQYIMATVAQNTVYQLRQDVYEKLNRMPLKFFDSRPHGEIMSRAVNDMDNISTTLQQSLTQLITSAVTLVGIVLMMLSISPILTLITVLTFPLSILVTTVVAKRSQGHFKDQQRALGILNGHIEEMYAGHKIVKAFGLEQRSISEFYTINEELYNAGWKAQFISGVIMPLMNFIGNIGYVFVSVVGGILITRRMIEIGDV